MVPPMLNPETPISSTPWEPWRSDQRTALSYRGVP